jgi:hypothetical protein
MFSCRQGEVANAVLQKQVRTPEETTARADGDWIRAKAVAGKHADGHQSDNTVKVARYLPAWRTGGFGGSRASTGTAEVVSHAVEGAALHSEA